MDGWMPKVLLVESCSNLMQEGVVRASQLVA